MGTNPICLNGDFFELDIKTRDVFHESFCVGICDRFLSSKIVFSFFFFQLSLDCLFFGLKN